MKAFIIIIFTFVLLFSATEVANTQITIHNWNFNSGNSGTALNQWPSPVSASTGSGVLTHDLIETEAFSGSTVNAEPAEAAGSALCPVNQTNNTKSFTLTVPTTGYISIQLSYATRRTSTGFTTQDIYYSIDGTNFVLDTTMTNINSSTFETVPRVVDFSDISGANDNANFKIKIVIDSDLSGTKKKHKCKNTGDFKCSK
ncbi:MAG: hypothetical protein HY800_07205 [Ignavibacteriales bacterium]|nr:hypothetical protein [Ignavibacteriales bacterium]